MAARGRAARQAAGHVVTCQLIHFIKREVYRSQPSTPMAAEDLTVCQVAAGCSNERSGFTYF